MSSGGIAKAQLPILARHELCEAMVHDATGSCVGTSAGPSSERKLLPG